MEILSFSQQTTTTFGKTIMNDGLILGRVVENRTHQGVQSVIVTLNHIVASHEMGPFQIRSEFGTSLVKTETNDAGFFALGFRWEPGRIGTLLSQNPVYQLNLQIITNQNGFPTARSLPKYRGTMTIVVSLRNIADGRIPDLRNPTTQASTIVGLALKLSRNIRIPNMFRSPGNPSLQYYALLGATEIHVSI